MSEQKHFPLRITAHLQGGVICDRFLPLDGVLFSMQMREAFGEQFVTAPGETLHRGGHPNPPFRRVRPSADTSYFACSFARWEGTVAEGEDAWNKRADWTAVDLVDFDGRRGKIDTAAGRYKSYHAAVYYRHALRVRWYAVGDRTEIERLLRFVVHLGKKREMGWGAVLRWEVESWPHDWSVRGPQGELMRALPHQDGPEFYGVRPPYWSRAHQRACYLPELPAPSAQVVE